MIEEGSFDSETTLCQAIKKYLETRKSRADRWLLKQFREYMEKKNPKDYQLKDITLEHFNSFLDFPSVSASRKNYEPRLKPFEAYIGLSQVKVKKNRNPKNDLSYKLEKEQKEHTKTKKQLASERVNVVARDGTINEQDQTIEEQRAEIKTLTDGRAKECSQCPKTVSFNKTIASNQATFDKERQGYKVTIDEKQYTIDTFESNSEEIEEIKRLLTQKTEIEGEIAKGKKIMEKQQIIKLPCSNKGGSLVPFGNDCQECDNFATCESYGELMNFLARLKKLRLLQRLTIPQV
jgi:hypothetical protein